MPRPKQRGARGQSSVEPVQDIGISKVADATALRTRQEDGPEPLAEVEMLCSEIAAELRDVVGMLTTYREIIGKAARVVAGTDGLEATELARELALIAHIEEEIEQLLPSSEQR